VARSAESSGNAQSSGDTAYFSWLDRRIIELRSDGDETRAAVVRQEILQARGAGKDTKLSRSLTVGGRTLLEGAAYFWFWTQCILATAILFVPVGILYRERTYIQDEVEVGH
jgi:POT family proton-dependent oligopeptide transporter